MAERNQPQNGGITHKNYEKYSAFIKSVISLTVRGTDYREDIFQELFVKFAQKPQLNSSLANKNLCFKVVKNFTINYILREDAYRKRLARYSDMKKDGRSSYRPSKTFETKDEFEHLMKLSQKHLSKQVNAIIRLRYIDQCSYEQIAKQMSLKKKTVIRYVCTGLRTLREVSGAA